MHPSVPSSAVSPSPETEISLLDIVLFLKRSWRTILLTGLAGLVLGIAYLFSVPKQYQASAQIQMAQMDATENNYSANKSKTTNPSNPLTVNIEEPSLLLARLSFPTSYTPEVIAACGLEGQTDAGAILAKSIKLSLPKAVTNVLDLKVNAATPEQAMRCANAIFELAKESQSQLAKPYVEDARQRLADNTERLARVKAFLARADQSGTTMGAAYLSSRDEVRYLLQDNALLESAITVNQQRVTRLIAPVYASDIPVAPKKHILLMGSVLSGLFLGLLFALLGEVIPKLREQLASRTKSA